jgi:hypothetical protein
MTFHGTLPAAAHITTDSSVLAVYDKGKHKGAVIRFQTVLKGSHGEPLASLVTSYFARGDGGFGGPTDGQPEPHQMPCRAPDRVVNMPTRPDQGLIYRLCGDRHPLQAIGVSEANPSRHVHLRNHLPRHSADLYRL